MKTYDIEIQRVKSMHQGHGLVYMRLDAAVQPQPRAQRPAARQRRAMEEDAGDDDGDDVPPEDRPEQLDLGVQMVARQARGGVA